MSSNISSWEKLIKIVIIPRIFHLRITNFKIKLDFIIYFFQKFYNKGLHLCAPYALCTCSVLTENTCVFLCNTFLHCTTLFCYSIAGFCFE